MSLNRPQTVVVFVDPSLIDQDEPRISRRATSAARGLLLILIVAVVYAPVLAGRFIYLDDAVVTDNLLLRSWWQGLSYIWTYPVILPHYQPLAYSSLLIEFKLFGTRFPGGYLAINLLLHMSNVLLLWMLLRKLQLNGALAAAILFAIHPINVQTVSWISQQPLLMGAVFSLLTMLAYLWGWRSLSLLLFGAALASYSTIAIAIPLLLLILAWWKRTIVGGLLPLGLMSLLFAALVMASDYRHAAATNTFLQTALPAQLLARLGSECIGLTRMIFPLWLTFIYPRLAIAVEISAILAGGILMVTAWRFGRGPFTTVVLAFAALLPSLFIRTDLDALSNAADQLFYLPTAIIIASTVTVFTPILRRRARTGPVVVACAAILLAGLTFLHMMDFRTSRRLWNSVLRNDPNSLAALNNLGLIEMNEEHNIAVAQEHFIRALEIDPKDVHTQLNIAQSYKLNGDYDKAIMRYEEARMESPDDLGAQFDLGEALAARGRSDEALAAYRKVLAKAPTHFMALTNLGMLLAQRGEFDQAIASYEAAIRIDPAYAPPYVDLAILHFQRGDITQADQTLQSLLKIDPRNFEAYLNAGAMVGYLAQAAPAGTPDRDLAADRAEQLLRQAVWLQVASPQAHFNLGVVLFLRDKLDEAAFQLSKAAELDPNDGETRRYLLLARIALQQRSSH